MKSLTIYKHTPLKAFKMEDSLRDEKSNKKRQILLHLVQNPFIISRSTLHTLFFFFFLVFDEL